MKINTFKSKNLFYDQELSWKKKRFSPSELKESFEPLECKWGSGNVTASDIFSDPTKEDKKKFDKFWVNKIMRGESSLTDIFEECKLRKISKNESTEIVDSATLCKQNLMSWSKANETLGKRAYVFSICGLGFGIVKGFFNNKFNSQFNNEIITKTFNFISSIFRSGRNFNQYSIYSLPDDDAAMNVYQSSVYGNKVAGSLACASTFLETKINPFILPFSNFLPSNISEPFKKLLSLPTSLWWRARMPAFINQEFFTDFLSYLLHKPLSPIFERSKEKVESIKKRNNLNLNYILKRHLYNLKVNKSIGEFIAPALGMYGFFASGIGNIGTSLLDLLNKECKILDFLQLSSVYSQQVIYLPKIIIPFFKETRMIKKIINDKEVIKSSDYVEKKEDLKRLVQKRELVSGIGLISFFSHTGNMLMKMFNVDENIFNITNELSGNLINTFFSGRRYLMGYQHRIENPEFVEE